MPNFSRGAKRAAKADFFGASLLDLETKKKLCLDLLAEFGARNVHRPNAKHEIIHSCPLPISAHRNGDSRPSASLNYERLVFNCLGCGAQGGLLWFIAICRGEDTLDGARAWLGGETGLGGTVLDAQKLVAILEGIFAQETERPEALSVFPEAALDPWTHPRTHPYMTHEGAFGGIQCRGIPEENCQRFQIGYAEKYPMGSFPDGSARPPQERIVIPIRWGGKLVGWQARAIRPGDDPKYKNSLNCPRDRVLFGWEPDQDVVLVESPMSVLRHCHHQPMVATFGKAVTDAQIRILQRARSVTVWFDSDPGGWQGTENVIAELKRYLPLSVVQWPYRDVDPADVSDQAVDEHVATAVPWSVWRRPTELRKWEE